MCLTTARILSYPRDEGKFIIGTEASQNSIGVVLFQIQNAEETVINYLRQVCDHGFRQTSNYF